MDHPNPIMCGCGIGYGIDKIRQIWIIRKFYMDYPMFRIGYLIIYLPRLKSRGIEDYKKVLVEKTFVL
jgi:hypothetical protein